jgi:hypothetical protein
MLKKALESLAKKNRAGPAGGHFSLDKYDKEN